MHYKDKNMSTPTYRHMRAPTYEHNNKEKKQFDVRFKAFRKQRSFAIPNCRLIYHQPKPRTFVRPIV